MVQGQSVATSLESELGPVHPVSTPMKQREAALFWNHFSDRPIDRSQLQKCEHGCVVITIIVMISKKSVCQLDKLRRIFADF